MNAPKEFLRFKSLVPAYFSLFLVGSFFIQSPVLANKPETISPQEGAKLFEKMTPSQKLEFESRVLDRDMGGEFEGANVQIYPDSSSSYRDDFMKNTVQFRSTEGLKWRIYALINELYPRLSDSQKHSILMMLDSINEQEIATKVVVDTVEGFDTTASDNRIESAFKKSTDAQYKIVDAYCTATNMDCPKLLFSSQVQDSVFENIVYDPEKFYFLKDNEALKAQYDLVTNAEKVLEEEMEKRYFLSSRIVSFSVLDDEDNPKMRGFIRSTDGKTLNEIGLYIPELQGIKMRNLSDQKNRDKNTLLFSDLEKEFSTYTEPDFGIIFISVMFGGLFIFIGIALFQESY